MTTPSSPIDVKAFIDDRPVARYQWLLVSEYAPACKRALLGLGWGFGSILGLLAAQAAAFAA